MMLTCAPVSTTGFHDSIFFSDDDRLHFLRLVARVVERFSWICYAYCLMDNHYHLIVELRRANLSLALQWLNMSYSGWFNRRHERFGTWWAERFKSVVVEDQPSSLEAVAAWYGPTINLAHSRHECVNPFRNR